jgi:hypothetical protein
MSQLTTCVFPPLPSTVRLEGFTGACSLANLPASVWLVFPSMHSNSRSIVPMSLQFSAHPSMRQAPASGHVTRSDNHQAGRARARKRGAVRRQG